MVGCPRHRDVYGPLGFGPLGTVRLQAAMNLLGSLVVPKKKGYGNSFLGLL